MSLETRSSSAVFKRAEQLKNWEESETNRAPGLPKEEKLRRIKFTSGCVFLAACAAGDKEEVLKLLDNGAKIDTANVDGLTALHQACIDDNLDMVEFLVEHGADVNRGDNEGWTPLHATASCGFLSIAKYLIEKGANVAAINNDGELPVDIAENQKMEDLLQEELDKRGIDCSAARSEEERIMLRDAKEWFTTKSSLVDSRHPDTGATPLHVAAAKGYLEVMKILFQSGADVDAQDVDGWTPLHAAAHWGQKEACQLLAENLADMDAKNFVGQTPFDLADTETYRYLEDLKKKQNKEDVNRRKAKKRIETQDRIIETETPSKVIKVEIAEANEKEDSVEKKNKVNSLNLGEKRNEEICRLPPVVPPKQIIDPLNDENAPSWRRSYTRQTKSDLPSPTKTPNTFRDRSNSSDLKMENEVTLRRNNSFQNDKEFYMKYQALHARIQAYKDTAVNPYSAPRPQSDIILSSYKRSHQQYSSKDDKVENSNTSTISATTTTTTTTTTSKPNSVTNQLSSPSSPQANSQPVRRSFVPPVRDEESETQRKAHAKRVRETRRSTQGVTLEDIKSAEQLVKKSNQSTTTTTTTTTTNSNNNAEQTGSNGESSNGVSVTATITTAAPTVVTRDTEEGPISHERRPSWRMRVDNGSSKFKLEDASKPVEPPSTPSYVRRTAMQSINNIRPASAPVDTGETTTVTIPLRRPKSLEDNEQDRENETRNAQATLATQAAIQRRRRPKRRSTGVVALDDLDQEKDLGAGGDFEDTSKATNDSGSERSSKSRLGNTADIVRNENGEIDYKKLYEETLAENERLKEKLKQRDEELKETKQTLEKLNLVTSKNSLSELEKRERRAMERKLSEMEEELKQLEVLKEENEKLKGENGALIRVISKLSK